MTLSSLGDLESVAGEHDAGIRAFDEAIALAVELGNDDDLPQFRAERARLLVRRGEIAAGRAELRRISRCPACIRSRSGCCADTWRTRRAGRATSTTPAPNSPSGRPRVIRDQERCSAATAAALLGVGAAQRGASDLGDPEVRATITVRAALGEAAADAAVAHARGLARPDGVALLQDYARGAGSGSATAASASATSRA